MTESGKEIHSPHDGPWLRALARFMVFYVLLMAVATLAVGLNRVFPGDETRFIATAEQFGRQFNLELLRTYEEMSTPLPFVIFGAWGRLFGYDLAVMRTLALAFGLGCAVMFHRFAFTALRNNRWAFWTSALWAIHPYVLLLSIFVYTDILAILFMLMGCAGLRDGRRWLLALGMGCALLCRQYMIFTWAAAFGFILLRWAKEKDNSQWKSIVALLIALAPSIALFIFWGGLTPQNQMRATYVQGPTLLHFMPSSVVLYTALCFLYGLPLVVVAWKKIYRGYALFLMALGLLYWAFPVRPSRSSEAVGVGTVGFFDRLAQMLLRPQGRDVIFFIAFTLGIPVVAAMARSAFREIRERAPGFDSLAALNILALLVVMPFSYLHWEKYFLPALPFLLIGLARLAQVNMDHASVEHFTEKGETK